MIKLCIVMVAVLAMAWAAESGLAQTDTDAAATVNRDDAAKLQAEIHQRITALLADSSHPLFTRHLRSVDALVMTEWAQVALPEKPNEKSVKNFVTFATKIRDGLNGDAGKWDSYASGERGLVFAFVSGYDQTLQLYTLNLPKGWEAEKSYPLIVYLHGHVGNPDPLWFAGWSFGPSEKAEGDKKPQDTVPACFRLGPWGRGNTGYRDAGETDVWEAMADAKANVKTDADRTYLSGHSMGGFGAWSIALRTPDIWAAVGIYSGGGRGTTTELAANMAYLPIQLWHGGADPTVPAQSARDMAELLGKVGNKPDVVIAEGVGHMVPGEAKAALRSWLLEHRRKRPDSFSFVADTSRHTGVWGITMRRDEMSDPAPRFECRIEGGIVRIDSKGTTGLDVNAGAGGLGLEGDVTIIWNGKEAYKGPVKQVQLGDGARRRGFRR